jgi:hypothetical protein
MFAQIIPSGSERMFVGMNPREQGDYGERAAVRWFWSKGAAVFVPVGHSPDYDMVADFGQGAIRVQVKTSVCRARNRWAVMLATRGGNQSWSGVAKYFSPARADYLFVLTGDGRQWFIPASEAGTSGMVLGGPKYAAFEVERGEPIPVDLAA